MNNELVAKVFKWFGLGLFVTFVVAYLVSTSVDILTFVFSGSNYLIIAILEIVCALWLSIRIYKMSSTTATVLYLGYSALTGLTFSSIFIVYEMASIIYVFLATAIVFLIFAMIGKNTKVDLNKFGIYLVVGLLSVIVLEIINLFLMNGTLDLVLCIVSIVIFIGYVAYDMQKIYNIQNYVSSDKIDNVAIIGAFNIYLDFINLFINLLRLFGRERD